MVAGTLRPGRILVRRTLMGTDQVTDSTDDSSSQAVSSATPFRRRRIARGLVRWTLLPVGMYTAICAVMMGMETRLLYPGAYSAHAVPMAVDRFEPDGSAADGAADGQVRPMDYQAPDGAPLAGRWITPPDPKRVILFLHGNGIRASEMDGWTRRLSSALDATVATAEYRGFQDDDYTPSETSTIEDAVAALDALAERTETERSKIIVYGRSLGGAVAAGLVAETMRTGDPVETVILDRTFSSVPDVASQQFWWLPSRYLIRNRYDSVSRLQSFQGTVIQIHGTPDRIVPMLYGRRLFDSLSTGQKHWIEIPTMYHNDRLPLDVLRQIEPLLP